MIDAISFTVRSGSQGANAPAKSWPALDSSEAVHA